MLDTKAQHHLMEDLTTAESDEPIQIPISPRLKTTQKNFFFFFFFFVPFNIRVIQIGDLSILQGRNGIPLGLLVESRTRDGSRSISVSIDHQVSKFQTHSIAQFPFELTMRLTLLLPLRYSGLVSGRKSGGASCSRPHTTR